MWYVSVNGGFFVNVTPETSCGRNVRSGLTTNGASRTLLAMNPSRLTVEPAAHASR